MSDKERVITEEYLQLFINTIKNDGPITFQKSGNLLAVDHPELGPLILQIKDKIVVNMEDKNNNDGSEE